MYIASKEKRKNTLNKIPHIFTLKKKQQQKQQQITQSFNFCVLIDLHNNNNTNNNNSNMFVLSLPLIYLHDFLTFVEDKPNMESNLNI